MAIFFIIVFFILVSVGVVLFFMRGDTAQSEPVGSLWAAAGFGLLAVLVAGTFNSLVLRSGVEGIASLSQLSRIGVALFVGINEEVIKFLPLALFIYKKKYFSEHHDGVLYFAICGLTFGMIENISYVFQYGTNAGYFRMFLTPVFHGATTGIVGYYLSSAKVRHKNPLVVILPLAGMAFAHAFYNYGLMSEILPFMLMSMLVSGMLATGLIMYFLHAKTLDHVLVPQLPQMATQGFCTHCGHANPSRKAYCQNCGHVSK